MFVFRFLGLAIGGLMGVAATVSAAAGQASIPEGITSPVPLAPFVASDRQCAAPTGLSRALTFAQDNSREFIEGVRFGLERAAADRELAFTATVADDDAKRMIEQVQAAHDDGVGAVVVAPVDPRTLAPVLEAVIADGMYVGAVVPPPAVTILNAPQYLTGRILAEAAAEHITKALGGKANVVILSHDSLQFLAPRFTAMRDVLREMPGVTIVADISPSTVNEEGGYRTMKTILLAQPRIDVVLGADTVVLGALRALREAGKTRPDQFLGGIDGEPDAVAEIRSGSSPYRATVSLASPLFGYALGQYAADWLEGRVVPQAMDILPTLLTEENLDEYEDDLLDPAAAWNDAQTRAEYLRMYGAICYETRDQFLNFPWSSEGG